MTSADHAMVAALISGAHGLRDGAAARALPVSSGATHTHVLHVVVDRAEAPARLSFSGAASARTYTVPACSSIEGEVLDAAFAVVQRDLLRAGVVGCHSAFIDVRGTGVLLVGNSGSGKSSCVVVALDDGHAAHSAELSLITASEIVVGEQAVTVDDSAVRHFGLTVPCDAVQRGTVWRAPLAGLERPRSIDILAFPRAANVATRCVAVDPRIAQVWAFEATASRAPTFVLLGNRQRLLQLPWTASDSERMIEVAFALCERPCYLVQGTPQEIVSQVAALT